MEAVRGQKHPSEAKNGMKELIYWNKHYEKKLTKNIRSTDILQIYTSI